MTLEPGLPAQACLCQRQRQRQFCRLHLRGLSSHCSLTPSALPPPSIIAPLSPPPFPFLSVLTETNLDTGASFEKKLCVCVKKKKVLRPSYSRHVEELLRTQDRFSTPRPPSPPPSKKGAASTVGARISSPQRSSSNVLVA